MGAVADLDDAGERRGPAGLRVAPEELEVDDGVGGRAFHELFEDWCPFLRAGDLVEAVEHFGGFDRVGPGFGLGARGLGDGGLVVGRERERGGRGGGDVGLTSWFTIQTIRSGRVRVRP